MNLREFLNDMTEQPNGRVINVNTGISIGLLGVIIVAAWTILGVMNGIRSDLGATRLELNARFDKIELRVNNLELTKNSWTATDMFKWAVHLQQANQNLKVPEPETHQ